MEAYGFEGADVELLAGGLINATFVARHSSGAELAVIQRLHPVFGAEVNLDIEAITERLVARGLDTPRLIRTRDGDAWVEVDGEIWRVLTYIAGETIDRLSSADQAAVSGEIVGRFHRALAGFDYEFKFQRAGVHDTDAHLDGLLRHLESDDQFVGVGEAIELGREIAAVAAHRPRWSPLPTRIAHGDLKISNVRFASLDPARARCLIDLDTLGRLALPYELGDAFRSWCNPAGESTEAPSFAIEYFAAGIEGYAGAIGAAIDRAELEAVPLGALTVALELAARFCVDVFEDRYFGWDPSHFASRREHNLIRARGQLALADSIWGSIPELERVVADALAAA